MNTPKRLINMVLRGHADKFKTVMREELENRVSSILSELYRRNSVSVINEEVENITKPPEIDEVCTTPIKAFLPETVYRMKDGNIGILNQDERNRVSKLYETLNNDGKERLVRLLSESQKSFNKILEIAKKPDHK